MSEHQNKEFSQQHWVSLEELEKKYWDNPDLQTQRAQEFSHKPIEYLEAVEKMSDFPMQRREFLTVMGASVAMSAVACAQRPVHKIIPHVTKPEEITVGNPNYYASTCMACTSHCGSVIKTRENRPIKLEGNEDHPLTLGALCARGQASLLGLYDPDRLQKPLQRVGSQGAEKTWDNFYADWEPRIKALQIQGKVRILTLPYQGGASSQIIQEVINKFSDARWVQFAPLDPWALAWSQMQSYGKSTLPRYFFDKADYVVSLGSDFLGTEHNAIHHAKQWSSRRFLENKNMTSLVVFESHFSITGASADFRYAIRAGDELKIGLSIVNELIYEHHISTIDLPQDFLTLVQAHSIPTVVVDLGWEQGGKQLKDIAKKLVNTKKRSLVVGSGALQSSAQGLGIVVNVLNTLLQNEGSTVDGMGLDFPLQQRGMDAVTSLVQECHQGKIDLLILQGVNPVYDLPKDLKVTEALRKVKHIVYLSVIENETSEYAHWVLPESHTLESWQDVYTAPDLYQIAQPGIRPLYTSLSLQELLLETLKKLPNVAEPIKSLEDWLGYIQYYCEKEVFKAYQKDFSSTASFSYFWEETLRKGFVRFRKPETSVVRTFLTQSLKHIRVPELKAQNLYLTLYPLVGMYDGTMANNPWLQELPHPLTSVTWDNYASISPGLAKRMYLAQNDVVRIKNDQWDVQVPVYVQPGLHDQSISLAIGYGHQKYGKVGTGVGVNAMPFVRTSTSHWVYGGMSVQMEKTGASYNLAATQWHTTSEHRPIINDITLDEYIKDPGMTEETDPELKVHALPSLWPHKPHETYKWGMSIDLTACIGCSACVIACQAENNVPVVGRQQVRNGRHMHWIRIDRYYKGEPENAEVVFQPMLCQHCENAPCETVCPVLATVHDDEGLNLQVYNRCVGTRYCQNNCPYKVRRFNFFDHWKSYAAPMNKVYNPSVTVRSRGIMEKCTFCIQRIRDVKETHSLEKKPVLDGDIKTACQSTCPTQAITFGNLNDTNSMVAKKSGLKRGFKSLEILNTKPSVTYLSKIRNKPHVHKG